jgi:glycosyltransferase involved in cell wall biosynthesis
MNQISVVLPTYNRLNRLKEVLNGLARQQYPLSGFEVVVVSDGSTDGTHEFLAALKMPFQLTPVIQANQGPAVARNSGIARASGDLVVFIDDDVVPTPQFLAEHARFHSQQPDRVVLGPMLSPPDFRLSPWIYWEQEMLMKQYCAMQAGVWSPTARQFYTGNTSLARQHLIAAGGFDARFRRAEDLELGFRLARRGLHFVFNPAAIGYHYAERSFRSWLEIPYSYGRNDIIFAREGETWIVPVLKQEFQQRNRLLRHFVRLCIDRLRLSRLIVATLRSLASSTYRVGLRKLSRFALSAVFNLRYYQGVVDELGGRDKFFNSPQMAV